MDDSKIIDLFFARNEEAIRQTDTAYGTKLFRLADRIVKDVQDAQECVNDTYLQTWNTIPPKRPQHFFAYLAALCRNISLNKMDWNKAAKRSAEVTCLTEEMEMCIPDTLRERELESRELGRLLDTFLRAQSDENQVVFLRRYWFADSVAEIAGQLGMSEGAVQMRLARTKARLCTFLEKEGIRV